MTPGSLRIGVLGGIPRSLGGGGLEVQVERTVQALNARGHQAFHVEAESEREFDLLHAFGNDVGVWHSLSHWRRNPAPLVVSPVLVVSPGFEERLVRGLNRIPWRGSEPYMRRAILRRADMLVALNNHERFLLSRLAPEVRCIVVGNGVPPDGFATVPEAMEELPDRTALLLGTVSRRKQQVQTILATRGTGYTPVVVGGLDGTVSEPTLRSSLAEVDGRWLGEMAAEQVHAVLSRSTVLLQLSRSEGQSLAVLEALSMNVPVILSPLPGNRELAEAYPHHVYLCRSINELPRVLERLPPAVVGTAPPVPTWDDVAEKLEQVYLQLVHH